MATNNFKPFGIGNGANVTSQTDYEALAALTSGFISGKASSAQINKALRQGTVMASVLAQFISDSSNVDVLDNGDAATILKNMKSAITALTPGRLLSVQVFTSTGSYTPTLGTKKIIVEAIAGGGGSNSCSVASGQTGGTSAGYYGQYNKSQFQISTLATPISVTVGAGGGANAAGGSTSFGSYMSLAGGKVADGTVAASGPGIAGNAYTRTGYSNSSSGLVLSSSNGNTVALAVIQMTAGVASGFQALFSPFPGGWYGRGADGIYLDNGASAVGKSGNPGIVTVWEYA